MKEKKIKNKTTNKVFKRRLTGNVFPFSIPLLPDKEKGYKPYPAFNGFTSGLQSLSCHLSVLNKDCKPHAPHKHADEEILMVLYGEVEIILPESNSSNENKQFRLKAGEFVYYPANFAHTLRTVSNEPANYLMFKWLNSKKQKNSLLAFGRFSVNDSIKVSESEEGLQMHLLFQGPTSFLKKLHCHTSTLTPGKGYDSHIDTHDVAIIVLEGEVETLGERAAPYNVILYPAGVPHGMYNPGNDPARYIVFEFHCKQKGLTGVRIRSYLSLLSKMKDPERLKKKLKEWLAKRGK